MKIGTLVKDLRQQQCLVFESANQTLEDLASGKLAPPFALEQLAAATRSHLKAIAEFQEKLATLEEAEIVDSTVVSLISEFEQQLNLLRYNRAREFLVVARFLTTDQGNYLTRTYFTVQKRDARGENLGVLGVTKKLITFLTKKGLLQEHEGRITLSEIGARVFKGLENRQRD
jgi:hypothetical protein